MLPLLPHSALTRTAEFVQEEWNTYFSNGRADAIAGGWKGILYANLALVDPVTSFNFFNSLTFDPSWLDGGASKTWYLAFAAGMSFPIRFLVSPIPLSLWHRSSGTANSVTGLGGAS